MSSMRHGTAYPHNKSVPKGQLTLIFLSSGLCLCASPLSSFPSNLDYFFLCWTQLYQIIAKGRKDFLARAKGKGVDVDTGIVTGKLSEKRLDARTRAEYQNRLDQWDR